MRGFDKLGRLSMRIAECETAQDRLESRLGLMRTEWAEMQDRLTKAYQRVERANQRAERRGEALPATPEALPALETASDPFSQKWRKVQGQIGAIPQRIDESAG